MTTGRPASRRPGQPLAALAMVLAVWVAMRALAWIPDPTPADNPEARRPVSIQAGGARAGSNLAANPVASAPGAPHGRLHPLRASFAPPAVSERSPEWRPGATAESVAGLPIARPVSAPGVHALAAFDALPSPARLPPFAAPAGSRWSGDGWLLYRRGSRAPAAAAGLFSSYGASQAGGVIRYHLAPRSPRAPQAYLRASRALDIAQSEAALGLSLRPFPGLPLRLLGETRVQRDAGRTRIRPAAAAISELPPIELPFDAQAEIYAQAGYVGGKGGTGFFDAQAAIDRRAARFGPLEARLGAGAWAGGQEGAARLDVGPRASVRLSRGGVSSRLALDWRFRVAGEARPGSGPAVTFSAGF